MIVGIVASLAGFVKARVSKTQVDNSVFRLHYRWTTCLCFLGCALIAANDLIGTPIECLDANQAETTYCWVSSTYTINTTLSDSDFNYYAAYGSDFHGLGAYNPKLHEKTFHAYYQWVPFILFFQGCLFYLPHQLWKGLEGKQVENLLQGLSQFTLIDESMETKTKNIIMYLSRSWGLNRKYFFGHFACEVLNLVNVVGQMFLLDTFFNGMFFHFGAKIFLLPVENDEGRFDPLIETFPRITKCDFLRVGPSGTWENKDILCVLPQNLLNEKIFLIMWIWFVILASVTVAQIIFRLAVFQFPVIRQRLLEQRGKVGSTYEVEHLVRIMHIGDFWLLYTIGKNLNAVCFKDILKGLTDSLSRHAPTAPKLHASILNDSFEHDINNPEDTIDRNLRKKIMDNTSV